MIGIILMAIMNATLYVGMANGMDNALNVAVFVMWTLAILHGLIMLASDAQLLAEPDKHFLYRWTMRLLILASVTHSVYWGYFWAPTVLLISAMVLWVRKYELDNRKRY